MNSLMNMFIAMLVLLGLSIGRMKVFTMHNDTSSSDVEDSHYEKDKGGYDVVTRATTNHGLHRGSFQGNAVIEAKASDDTTKNFLFLTGVRW